ncbi:hypothetical protein DID78_06515 [Candidatus Marinamargulisbacteria bacterium SCGC AG-343-D04]|nr:hypothetical protein DID78_06515 [Candidatus Marinamargulisbacteria bacterium SCGC AG-343-D04]
MTFRAALKSFPNLAQHPKLRAMATKAPSRIVSLFNPDKITHSTTVLGTTPAELKELVGSLSPKEPEVCQLLSDHTLIHTSVVSSEDGTFGVSTISNSYYGSGFQLCHISSFSPPTHDESYPFTTTDTLSPHVTGFKLGDIKPIQGGYANFTGILNRTLFTTRSITDSPELEFPITFLPPFSITEIGDHSYCVFGTSEFQGEAQIFSAVFSGKPPETPQDLPLGNMITLHVAKALPSELQLR